MKSTVEWVSIQYGGMDLKDKLKKITKKQIFLSGFLVLSLILSLFFVRHNYAFYQEPVAKIIETQIENERIVVDGNNNQDQLFTQSIVAELKNGEHEGQLIYLENTYSDSGANDQNFLAGDDLFVSIQSQETAGNDLTGTITGVKRDHYIVMVAWVFIVIVLAVGRKSGLFSLISLTVNVLLLVAALGLVTTIENISLLVICSVAVVLFTFVSLLMVSGNHRKTYAAILATLIGTFLTLFIAYIAMALTSERGLHYEEMGFATRTPQKIFMASVLVGSLGAVMDIAITMSSSVFELYVKNKAISSKALMKSGMVIGRDIMGTMTNILLFSYISGSIPMILLYLRNGSSLMYTLSMNLSLDLARALAGSIGIVLTIPIALYTAVFAVRKRGGAK